MVSAHPDFNDSDPCEVIGDRDGHRPEIVFPADNPNEEGYEGDSEKDLQERVVQVLGPELVLPSFLSGFPHASLLTDGSCCLTACRRRADRWAAARDHHALRPSAVNAPQPLADPRLLPGAAHNTASQVEGSPEVERGAATG